MLRAEVIIKKNFNDIKYQEYVSNVKFNHRGRGKVLVYGYFCEIS
jgi:hypothetical protein